jgi:hypothetical protein
MSKIIITEKLPVAFKAKFLKALRSGKYKKGKSYLVNQTKDNETVWCCLGVAGNICGVKNFGGNQFLSFKNEQTGKRSSLRGLSKVPKILKGNVTGTVPVYLASLNDKTKTFEQVIEWIEKNL